jgi:hypothetical protein
MHLVWFGNLYASKPIGSSATAAAASRMDYSTLDEPYGS